MPTTTISGARVFYLDEGEGDPVLLIHAFPLNSAMWAQQIAALAPHRRVIAPDMPGFGESILGSGDKSIDRYADTLAALLDHVGIARAAVVGLSMGGYIALALVRRHAERVRALVLADTKASADSEEARAKRGENGQLVLEHGQEALAERLLPTLLSAGAPETLKGHVREIARANSRDGLAAALKAMASRPDSTDMLSQITIQTAIIVGEHDTVTPHSDAEQMHARIAGSNLTVIPNAGHLSNLEQPEAFNAGLLAALK